MSVFRSLREARAWLAGIDESERRADAGRYESSPWSDPQREAVMFRRGQKRELPIRPEPAILRRLASNFLPMCPLRRGSD